MSAADRDPLYPGMLGKLQPGQAVDVLNERVRQVGKLNTAVADWLQERRRLEDQYAAGLRRLARNQLDDVDLGIFSVPWASIIGAMDSLAESHTALAAKVEADIERPLREFATKNRNMQAITTTQGNLGALAKDVERAQQKTDKLQDKGDRAGANKLSDATDELDNAQVQWQVQAPYVFEQLQALDEVRLNHLRDLLTQFTTIEVDQVEKHRVAAEHCLNILLNVETQDEIATFALKAVAVKPSAPKARRSMAIPSTPTRGAGVPPVPISGSTNLAPEQSNQEENASQISTSAQEKDKKDKGPLKGLKRLGTVMGRRSSKMPSGPLPPPTESTERKPKTSRFGLGRSKSSHSNSEAYPEESSSSRPPIPHLGSEAFETSSPHRERAVSSVRDSAAPQLDLVPHANGTAPFSEGGHQGDFAASIPPVPALPDHLSSSEPPSVPEPSGMQRDGEGFSLPPQNLDPISQAEAALTGEAPQPQYNVNIRNAPIQEEGGAAALESVANKLQAPPLNSRRLGTVRGRRDARNSVISTYVPPDQAPNFEAPPSATALESERSRDASFPTPVSQPPSSVTQTPTGSLSAFSPVQSPSSAFGNTAAPAAGFAMPLASSDTPSAIRPASRAALAIDYAGDNQSIKSGRSLASTGSQGLKHPDLNETGLNSSIVETISARFENGKLTSSSLIGEIALAYNAPNFSSPFGHEIIRLENFSSLDRVAPNPAFLDQTSRRDGEYSLNLSSITRTQIAFKYQVRHEDASAQVPLLIAPAFKTEASQTSVIVNYSLHPGFTTPGQSSITLSNVTLALTLEGAKPINCMSKPVGTFARERNLIYWSLGDITLTPGATPQKLLARFATDSEATGGSVEAKWEITGTAAGSGIAISVSNPAGGDANTERDPFADEDNAGASTGAWRRVPTVVRSGSGSYVAK